MPQQAVLSVGDPMALIWEVQESAGNALALEDVECLHTLGNYDTVVLVVVNDELGGLEVVGVCEGVPFFVVGTVIPDCAVVVTLDEPELISGVRADLVNLAVVADRALD